MSVKAFIRLNLSVTKKDSLFLVIFFSNNYSESIFYAMVKRRAEIKVAYSIASMRDFITYSRDKL